MAAADTPRVNREAVEALLKGRPPLPRETDCEEMGAVATALAGFKNPEGYAEVSRHLSECRSCRDAVLMLCTIDETVDASAASSILPLRPRKSGPLGALEMKTLAIAASLLLVAGATLFALFHSNSSTSSGDEMRIKGAGDSLLVGVSRGLHRFGAEPFDRLSENDNLGLFYTAEEAGFLMVVNKDNDGAVSLLYPVGETKSGAIRAGKEISLPDGAVVGAGSGCEWIIAIFSDVPVRLTDVTRALSEAPMSHGHCVLEVTVPGARTVRVLPFRR